MIKNLHLKSLFVLALISFSFMDLIGQNAPTFNANQDPKPEGKKWVPVDELSDEFEGESLDNTKWSADPSYIWTDPETGYSQERGWYGSSRSLFEEDNAFLYGGQLRVEAEMFDSPKYAPTDDQSEPAKRKYGGAYVVSKTLAEPGYYMEAKMQASSTAMSSAFWLMSPPDPCVYLPNNGEKLELDIQECVGVLTGTTTDSWTKDDWAISSDWNRIFHFNTHRHNTQNCYTGDQETRGGKINLDNPNQDAYHIYAAYWHADGSQIDYFLNGELIKSVTPAVPFKSPLRLIMSSNFYEWIKEISPADMGFEDPKWKRCTKFEWVRTWKLEDDANSESFFIVNKHTGKKIRPKDDIEGSLMVQAPADWTGDFVQWQKVDAGNGYFYLRNIKTGMYFRPVDDSENSNLEIRPTSWDGTWTQWEQVETTGDYFYLKNRETGDYFRPSTTDDIGGATGTDFNMVQKPTSFDGDWTQWKFVSVTDGSSLKSTGLSEGSLLTEKSKDNIDLMVYPNPVIDQLTIGGLSEGTNYISIYGLKGNVVFADILNVADQKAILDIQGLPSGIYLLNIKNEKSLSSVLKFVKQ